MAGSEYYDNGFGTDKDYIDPYDEIYATPKTHNKYEKRIKNTTIDVYDVLVAFDVTCPAMQHAIKKCLMSGQRGYKDSAQDKREAIQSIERSIELGEYPQEKSEKTQSAVGDKDYWIDRMETE